MGQLAMQMRQRSETLPVPERSETLPLQQIIMLPVAMLPAMLQELHRLLASMLGEQRERQQRSGVQHSHQDCGWQPSLVALPLLLTGRTSYFALLRLFFC